MAELLRVVDFDLRVYVDDMDLETNLEDYQDDPAGRGTVALKRGRLYAYCVTV